MLGDEPRAAVILRQLLDGPIRVIPSMRIDEKRVVPRLEFTLNLVEALPPAVSNPLTEKPDHVPRWCSKHWLKAGAGGGGKRRRAS